MSAKIEPLGRGRPGLTDLHRSLVADLVSRGYQTTGIAGAVRDVSGVDIRPAGKFVPDAYRICAASRTVSLYEVTVWHRLSALKVDKIGTARDLLAHAGWTLKLYDVGIDGQHTELDPSTGSITDAELAKAIRQAGTRDEG